MKRERGFSLLEAMAALGILSLATIGILPAFIVQLRANTRSEIRSGAVRAVQQALEELRLEDPVTLPDSGSTPPQLILVGDHEYAVVTSFCLRDEFCGTSSRHIEVEVSYEGRRVYAVETVYTQLL